MGEFKKAGAIMFCPACRVAYEAKGHTLDDKCPICKKIKWIVVFDASSLLDHIENSEALGVIIDQAQSETVARVAKIMGFHGGCCSTTHKNNDHMKELRAFAERRGE